MVFRCPNVQAHYNEAVLCLNFGTPENNEFFHLGQMENLLFLGVPILKHIRVALPVHSYRQANKDWVSLTNTTININK